MHDFTPFTGLIGGLLIGLASTLMLWLNGRITGISHIAGHMTTSPAGDRLWRLMFVIGLLVGALLYFHLGGHPPVQRSGMPLSLLALSGLLVGFGTSLANGCTSGHGVCGLARLSPRSGVATLVFLVTGIISAVIFHGLLGL
ncbi:MAG: YeeE/YedE family protein [Pseudomonadales bacterium]|nr:YeeE/YedE family protein [Pseudomonadales bacterium]